MQNKLTGATLERRNRGIAANAVYETRKALGRGHLPVTDDEAARLEMIYKILSSMVEGADEQDAGLLVPSVQPELPQSLVNVERLLSDIDDDSGVIRPSIRKQMPTKLQLDETK